MLADVGDDALGGGPCGQLRGQDEIRNEQSVRVKTPILPESVLKHDPRGKIPRAHRVRAPSFLFTLRLFTFAAGCPQALPQLQIEPLMESRPAGAANRARSSSALFEAWARVRTSPGWIVAIALLLRVGWIVIGHTYKFKSTDDNFGFGWEMGRIGASLASGHGFSNPFGPATGPTAWEPPLYPYLIAGVFRVFGIYSKSVGFRAAGR